MCNHGQYSWSSSNHRPLNYDAVNFLCVYTCTYDVNNVPLTVICMHNIRLQVESTVSVYTELRSRSISRNVHFSLNALGKHGSVASDICALSQKCSPPLIN